MKSLAFNQKRLVAGIWLVVFLIVLGNEYLEWGILGNSAKLIRSIVMFVGLLALVRFGPKMFEEMEFHRAARRESEKVAELERDKSSDSVEAHQLRHSLGMPIDASKEPAAQQSAPEDALKQRASEH